MHEKDTAAETKFVAAIHMTPKQLQVQMEKIEMND